MTLFILRTDPFLPFSAEAVRLAEESVGVFDSLDELLNFGL